MSTILTFTGNITTPVQLYNGVTVFSSPNPSAGENTPAFIPGADICPTLGANTTACYNFLFDQASDPNNSTITWDNGGDFLSDLTVNDLFTNSLFANNDIEVDQTYTFTATSGQQQFTRGKIIFYLLNPDQSQLMGSNEISGRSDPDDKGSNFFGGNTIYDNQGKFSSSISSTRNNRVIIAGSQAQAVNSLQFPSEANVTNATLSVSMRVQLKITCTTSNITSGICLRACRNDTASLTNCVDTFQETCLADVDSDNNTIIFTNSGCQSFFTDFLKSDKGPGPDNTLDTAFSQACKSRFPGIDLTAYRSATAVEQDICACHLDPQIYINLQQSLEQQFPGSQLAAENKVCLFPDCASSNYPSVSSTKVCPVPECFELASINNQGQLTGGATIQQRCKDLTQSGSAHSPSNNGSTPAQPTKSWIERHWVWLAVGIGLAIILIIIIIILV